MLKIQFATRVELSLAGETAKEQRTPEMLLSSTQARVRGTNSRRDYMIQDSIIERFEVFFATATVAAHAQAPSEGFRQRDVRFLIEFFSNWVESSLEEKTLPVQNIQVARYLKFLATEGYARQISRKGYPSYRLTRTGLIELMSRLVGKHYVAKKEQFFFLFFFIKNYKQRLEQLVQSEGQQFPFALKIELEHLLNEKNLLNGELSYAKQELRKLEARIQDSHKVSDLSQERLKGGKSLPEIIAEIQHLYPYELNSQKPLHSLMELIPEPYRKWELETGTKRRIEEIWAPSRDLLACYINSLEGLL